jgi:hypothetical protein
MWSEFSKCAGFFGPYFSISPQGFEKHKSFVDKLNCENNSSLGIANEEKLKTGKLELKIQELNKKNQNLKEEIQKNNSKYQEVLLKLNENHKREMEEMKKKFQIQNEKFLEKEAEVEVQMRKIENLISTNIKNDFSNNDGNNKRKEIDSIFYDLVTQLIPKFKSSFPKDERNKVGKCVNSFCFKEIHHHMDEFMEEMQLKTIKEKDLKEAKEFLSQNFTKELMKSIREYTEINKDLMGNLISKVVDLKYLMIHEDPPFEFIQPNLQSTYDSALHEGDLEITIKEVVYPGLKAKNQQIIFKKAKVKLESE